MAAALGARSCRDGSAVGLRRLGRARLDPQVPARALGVWMVSESDGCLLTCGWTNTAGGDGGCGPARKRPHITAPAPEARKCPWRRRNLEGLCPWGAWGR